MSVNSSVRRCVSISLFVVLVSAVLTVVTPDVAVAQTTAPSAQTGQVVINSDWHTVALDAGFVDPVVVAGPTNSGFDPSVVQINNVTTTSFQIRVQEWAYLDGVHDFVLASYLVVERGRTDLPSGARIEAGTTSATVVPAAIAFSTPFPSRPAVITTPVSDGAAVAPRVAGVGGPLFFLLAQGPESGPAPGPTDVNWIAWSTGTSGFGDPAKWAASSRLAGVGSGPTPTTFGPGYSKPCIFAEANTANGIDPGSVRHSNLTPSSVNLAFQEEQSLDLETVHLPETLAFLVIDCPAALEVQAAGTTAILNPAFSPFASRYSIHPGDSGSEVLLNIATSSTADFAYVEGTLVPHGTAYPLDTHAPGDTLDVQIFGPSGIFNFEVILLPEDFPYLLTYTNTPAATNAPLYVTANNNSSDSHFVILMDNNGVPYGYRTEATTVGDFKRHDNGQFSYSVDCRNVSCDGSTQFNADYVHLDANFNELRRFRAFNKVNTDIHDHIILPNGNDVLISWEEEVRDLTPFGGGPNDIVQSSIVQQQDQAGNIIFEWNTWDGDVYKDRLIAGKAQYAHMNSVFYSGDDMVVSLRGTSQIINVDRTTGDVNWRLGGLTNDFTFVNDPLEGFCGQHTASILPNGNLLLFDNGSTHVCVPGTPERGEYTRVVEYALDLNAMTATLVWSYAQPGAGSYSFFAGSSDRLPNGNTLIGWGGRQSITGLLLTEVTPSGDKALEIVAIWPDGSGVFSYRSSR